MTDPQIKVTYLNHMGDDLTTVNAARVSFNKTSEWETSCALCGNSGADVSACVRSHMGQGDSIPCTLDHLSVRDQRLIEYLGRHGHDSPFNHNALSVHVKMPIFVARQLVKHEYLVMNEVSRRYIDTEPEIYVPDVWRTKPTGSIKQGSGVSAKQPNKYGDGVCWFCRGPVVKPKSGPTGKWCSEKCRTYWRKENNPDDRLTHVKGNAKKRGIEYDLTRGDVEWTTHCPVLGVELNYRSGENVALSPSVDRIDSTRGYVKGNVMVMSQRANLMKQDASPKELVKFAEWVLLRYKGCVVPEETTYEGMMRYMVDYYNYLIDEGYAPEQARMVLPLSTLTEWHWTGLLSAWAKMVNQRIQPDTQYETRLVAQQVDKIASELWPHSWKALRSMNL